MRVKPFYQPPQKGVIDKSWHSSAVVRIPPLFGATFLTFARQSRDSRAPVVRRVVDMSLKRQKSDIDMSLAYKIT